MNCNNFGGPPDFLSSSSVTQHFILSNTFNQASTKNNNISVHVDFVTDSLSDFCV